MNDAELPPLEEGLARGFLNVCDYDAECRAARRALTVAAQSGGRISDEISNLVGAHTELCGRTAMNAKSVPLFFHRTSVSAARAILVGGFKDADGTYMTDRAARLALERAESGLKALQAEGRVDWLRNRRLRWAVERARIVVAGVRQHQMEFVAYFWDEQDRKHGEAGA